MQPFLELTRNPGVFCEGPRRTLNPSDHQMMHRGDPSALQENRRLCHRCRRSAGEALRGNGNGRMGSRVSIENSRSIVSFAHAVLPRMQERRWGRIVTITSLTLTGQKCKSVSARRDLRFEALRYPLSAGIAEASYRARLQEACPWR
jgi:hypothetical protein